MIWKLKKPAYKRQVFSTSKEIRTLVLTLKGLCPGPLDDGGMSSSNDEYNNGCSRFRQEICEKFKNSREPGSANSSLDKIADRGQNYERISNLWLDLFSQSPSPAPSGDTFLHRGCRSRPRGLRMKKPARKRVFSTSKEIRTLVLTLKGLCPGPLDDGGSSMLVNDIHFSRGG